MIDPSEAMNERTQTEDMVHSGNTLHGVLATDEDDYLTYMSPQPAVIFYGTYTTACMFKVGRRDGNAPKNVMLAAIFPGSTDQGAGSKCGLVVMHFIDDLLPDLGDYKHDCRVAERGADGL
jgi:hypothetical protein